MAQPDLNLGAAASATPHGLYSGVDRFDDPNYHAHVHVNGWKRFAATMIFVACAGNVMWGLAALSGDRHFKADQLLVGSLTAWGVVALAMAFVQFLTAVLIFGGSAIGTVLGIGLAAVSMLVQLGSIGAYPVWSVFVIVIDALVIYGLSVHSAALE